LRELVHTLTSLNEDLGCFMRETDLIKSRLNLAKKLGIIQPKVSALVSGKLSDFSTDTLLHYLSTLGCKVEIKIRRPRTTNIFRQGDIRRIIQDNLLIQLTLPTHFCIGLIF